MQSLNISFLKDLEKKIHPAQLEKLKRRSKELASELNTDNIGSPKSHFTSESPQTGTRRPKNKRLIQRNKSPELLTMTMTKGSSFNQNKQTNKERAIYYNLSEEFPNLHSQDVMTVYYSKEDDDLYKSQSFHNPKRKTGINKSLTLQELNNLKQMQFFFCNIDSLRTLGTGWKIKSLTIIGGMLTDFAGITGFGFLEDLFTSYNKINNLSQLLYNQTLQNIDLEGNNLTDITQVDYLQTIQNLKYLNLTENPIYRTQKVALLQKFGVIINFQELQQLYQFQMKELDNGCIWDAYEGYQEIILIDQINRKLAKQKSIFEEMVYGIKNQNNNNERKHFEEQGQENNDNNDDREYNIELNNKYQRDNKQLVAYLQEKLSSIAIRKLDPSKSRSKPKLLEIHSKEKVVLKVNKEEESTVTSSMLANTGKSFRESIRAEAKKKFLVRKSSVKKQPDQLGLKQPNSMIIKGRQNLLATTSPSNFHFGRNYNMKI